MKAAKKPIGELDFYERQKAASERRDERGRQQLRANQLQKQNPIPATHASLVQWKEGETRAKLVAVRSFCSLVGIQIVSADIDRPAFNESP